LDFGVERDFEEHLSHVVAVFHWWMKVEYPEKTTELS